MCSLLAVVVVDAPANAGRRRLRIAPGHRVARVSGRTGARGHPVASVALGVHAALARARVPALVVDARLVVTALDVGGALAAPAPGERVARVTWQARAHRPLLAGDVVAGLAPGVLAARVRFAEVGRLERPAPDERVAGHGPRAAAYGRRAPRLAVGVDAAHAAAGAWVHAPFARARRAVRRAVGVRQTLGPARSVRVAEVTLWTRAGSPAIVDVTYRSWSTGSRSACGSALVLLAHLGWTTIVVGVAFVTATGRRRTHVTRKTGAHRHVVNHFTFGVLAARAGIA